MADRLVKIALVDPARCKPKKCAKECKKYCPVVRMGKECVVITTVSSISEEMCIGCKICAKKCPFEAISIINLPAALNKEIYHRYSQNSFVLSRLPQPRRGQVLGLVGSNGTGKTTALKIISGLIKPNFGDYKNVPTWEAILERVKGQQDLHKYFTKLLENKMTFAVKPQHVDMFMNTLPHDSEMTVDQVFAGIDERGVKDKLVVDLGLRQLLNRQISDVSGGELQRFAIAYTSCKRADMYMFDEPSSYLDIKQRLIAARLIRSLLTDSNYVVVVEHDLSVLDFMSDYVCLLYGTPGAFGVVTYPYSVRQGINIFLAGFIPTENMRFREIALDFKIRDQVEATSSSSSSSSAPAALTHFRHSYPAMNKTLGSDPETAFRLQVEPGFFADSEIIVLLGENGTGKTTFIRMLAGQLPSDNEDVVPKLNISYKPQRISPKFEGTVRELLFNKAPAFTNSLFISDVVKPLNITPLLDLKVLNLSGGELQRVALCLCLGKPADIYLIDEPSAYMDSEQRIIAAKVIKRFIMHSHKTAFVVEHDFIMATYLADRVIVYSGSPSESCVAHTPQALVPGMNTFLKSMDITIRRDWVNFRPRINKLNCVKDREQKLAGTYFYTGDEPEEDY